jgi:hypothetical protein
VKFVVFLFVLLSFIAISSLYISKEDHSLDLEISSLKHADNVTLNHLHEKFKNIDMNLSEKDLNKAIEDIKKARKLYPLDDKLKMIDIELEHIKADRDFKPLN